MSSENTQAAQAANAGAVDAQAEDAQARSEPAEGADQSSAEERAAQLERELESARAQIEAAREASLRAAAEAENVRKRAARDLENAHKFALDRFVAELLPVKDSMELGLAAESADVAQLREGTEMTLRMLRTAVEKFGVTEVDPDGEAFDPEVHQAMTTREVDGVAPGTVVQVVQKGYLLNERLVRPAMVIVAR